MQCRRRFRRTGPHPVFRCVSMRRMPFLNRESTGLLRFSTSVSTVWKTQREKKSHLSSSFASPENLRCGICCGGLWNEISTTCAKYDNSQVAGFPRNSPQTFLSTPIIFPLFHAGKLPLFRILSTNVLWGKSPRNFRQKAGFPTFPGSLLVLLYLFYLSILFFAASLPLSRIRRCLLETYNSKLFLQSGHICKKHRNCVRFLVFPGGTRRQRHSDQKESAESSSAFQNCRKNHAAEKLYSADAARLWKARPVRLIIKGRDSGSKIYL